MDKPKDKVSQKHIIDEIKRIAREKHLDTVPLSVFKSNSKISDWFIWKVFDTWNEAIELAGLKPDISSKKKTDDELFYELLKICKKIGKIPNTPTFQRNSKFGMATYKRRWSKWNQVISNFKEWLKQKYPDSEFIALIPDKPARNVAVDISQEESSKHGEFVWRGKKGIIYGTPIDFRGLRHEPVNEQGVVFLFGKISEELGFSIEAIRTNYPDCDGKRLIDKNKNLWEPVSIEFEYCSSNFKEHGHDPSKCDVIICWVHDWEDCPVEVIELRKVVKQLKQKSVID